MGSHSHKTAKKMGSHSHKTTMTFTDATRQHHHVQTCSACSSGGAIMCGSWACHTTDPQCRWEDTLSCLLMFTRSVRPCDQGRQKRHET
eukprot:199316-Chlamydomonas_euryale.AAC.1